MFLIGESTETNIMDLKYSSYAIHAGGENLISFKSFIKKSVFR